jgi:pimeloyl-ACP methyl ester carboxylesterase
MEELRIRHAGISLAASYSPAGDTAVVALHGASEGTRGSALYKHLHALLPSAGIGVVTFDRRGEGESTGEPSRGRFNVQADDALAVSDAIDAKRVGLWGFSQGAWVAPLAAVHSSAVSFLVLVASTGVTPSEQMMYAVERQLRLAGYSEPIVARALDLRLEFEDWIHASAPERDEQLATALRAAADEPWWPHLWLPSSLVDEEGRRAWVAEMDFDPRPTFAQVRVPTLLFYGAADSWTPVEASIRAWRAARRDVEIITIDGVEHDLTQPDGTISREYERTMVAWLRRRALSDRAVS